MVNGSYINSNFQWISMTLVLDHTDLHFGLQRAKNLYYLSKMTSKGQWFGMNTILSIISVVHKSTTTFLINSNKFIPFPGNSHLSLTSSRHFWRFYRFLDLLRPKWRFRGEENINLLELIKKVLKVFSDIRTTNRINQHHF